MGVIESVRRFMSADLRVGNAGALGPDVPLVQKGVIDSIELMQIVGFLETEFGIAVEDTDIVPGNFRSLATMAAFVERKRGAAPP